MDYATKFIVLSIISFIVCCLLFQYEVLTGIFDSIGNLIGSFIDPIKNLIGNFI